MLSPERQSLQRRLAALEDRAGIPPRTRKDAILGDSERALQTIREADDQMRRIEAAGHDPLSPNMPELLISYAQCLADSGMIVRAREVISEAAERLRPLATSQPKFADLLGTTAALWRSYLLNSENDTVEARREYETMTECFALARELVAKTGDRATAGTTGIAPPRAISGKPGRPAATPPRHRHPS